MKIAVIHSANLGFFPRFFQDLCTSADKAGYEIRAFLPNSGQNRRRTLALEELWGSKFNWFAHFNLYKWTGIQDLWSVFSTIDLIRRIKKFQPDIVHLNGICEYILCFPLFVRSLNKLNKPVVWTFHDMRYITARCPYDEDLCSQWKTGCRECRPDVHYVKSKLNCVSLQWKLKSKWFNRINNLTIVTPSQWLANQVSESFLKHKPLVILNNGVDTLMFSKPSGQKSASLENLDGKIILGVAIGWEHRKGLDTMIWLSKNLPEEYHIVLVGGISTKVLGAMPDNILCLPRTGSKEELIAIYQKADVFVNPTLADNFPTVNIESLGAGLPVVTFNTGGSAESIDDTCGISVEKGNNEALLNAILEVCTHPEKYSKENCIRRSQQFSLAQFDKYMELFRKLSENGK